MTRIFPKDLENSEIKNEIDQTEKLEKPNEQKLFNIRIK